jgi:hypothetical protein
MKQTLRYVAVVGLCAFSTLAGLAALSEAAQADVVCSPQNSDGSVPEDSQGDVYGAYYFADLPTCQYAISAATNELVCVAGPQLGQAAIYNYQTNVYVESSYRSSVADCVSALQTAQGPGDHRMHRPPSDASAPPCVGSGPYGSWSQGGGCGPYGCWSAGGGCNAYGCWIAGGGCNAYGCWQENGSCTAFGCSDQLPSMPASCQ